VWKKLKNERNEIAEGGKMISTRITALVTVLLLFFATHGYAGQVNYDGAFWKKSDQATKELIVAAVFWGQEAAYDQVFAETFLSKGDSNFKVECATSVKNLTNSLAEKQKSIDIAQVVGHMDKFYAVPNNMSLRLKWAFLEAMLRVQGTPEEEIKEFIDGVRNSQK
jgi:hypothetical protein